MSSPHTPVLMQVTFKLEGLGKLEPLIHRGYYGEFLWRSLLYDDMEQEFGTLHVEIGYENPHDWVVELQAHSLEDARDKMQRTSVLVQEFLKGADWVVELQAQTPEIKCNAPVCWCRSS